MAAAETPLVPASEYDGGALVAVDPYGQEAKLSLRNYHVDVHVEDGFARTTIDQTYFNSIALAAGGDVLLPAAAGRLAVAPGHVRRRQPHGRRHGRSRMGQCRLREGRAVASATRRCSNGWTAARSRCASSRWKGGRRSASSSATRSGCRRSTAARSTASRPATACKSSITGRSTPSSRTAARARWNSPTHPAMRSRRDGDDLVLDAADSDCKVDRDVEVDMADPQENSSFGERVRFSTAETGRRRLPDAALPAGTAGAQGSGSGATGSSCSSRRPTAIRCWRGRRSKLSAICWTTSSTTTASW